MYTYSELYLLVLCVTWTGKFMFICQQNPASDSSKAFMKTLYYFCIFVSLPKRPRTFGSTEGY